MLNVLFDLSESTTLTFKFDKKQITFRKCNRICFQILSADIISVKLRKMNDGSSTMIAPIFLQFLQQCADEISVWSQNGRRNIKPIGVKSESVRHYIKA